MILGFVINKVESERLVPLDELSKYRNINVNYDINLRNLSVIKPAMGPKEVLRIEYSVTINYLNPTIGFHPVRGVLRPYRNGCGSNAKGLGGRQAGH